MPVDETTLKNSFARYPTGVTVVSCLDADNTAIGMTVNSYTPVSLNPPLVLWCISRHISVFGAFEQARSFGISILAHDQAAASVRFASHGQHQLKDDEWEDWITGAPLLKERLAGLDCKVVDRHDGGDHVIVTGEVTDSRYRDGKPLIYAGRNYLEGPEITE